MEKILQKKTPLLSAMLEYTSKSIVSFDVPGHKRRLLTDFAKAAGNAITLDINSSPDMDLLDNPKGVILEAEGLLADAYDADHAFFMVNGSTFGVQVMIMAACPPGTKIILPRNAHKSAINALILSGAVPVFIQPEMDSKWGIAHGVSVEAIKQAIEEHPDAKAVFVINPTYFGAASDLRSIVNLAHRHHMAVLVDEAHGAHLPFHRELPRNAMQCGADMATLSIHKTAGSLTQSSALLLNDGLMERSIVRSHINLMQTTSASYLLMASLDAARKMLALEGRQLLERTLTHVRSAREEISKIPGLEVLGYESIGKPGIYDYDETKIVIRVNDLGLTGYTVYQMLREKYSIQVELAETYCILAVASMADDAESLGALVNALKSISVEHFGKQEPFHMHTEDFMEKPKMVVTPREAYYSKQKAVPLSQAAGEISGESIMAYPPGIPIVIPGERITEKTIAYYKFIRSQHGNLVTEMDEDMIVVLGE